MVAGEFAFDHIVAGIVARIVDDTVLRIVSENQLPAASLALHHPPAHMRNILRILAI